MVNFHSFWAAAAEHAAANKGSFAGFLDWSFVLLAGNRITSQVAILALLDLPYRAESHGLRANEGRKLEVKAANNLIMFVKEVRETDSSPETSVTVVQRYFDLGDRLQERELEDFLVNRAYGCEVIMTNVSSRQQEFSVLVQIPQGSLPLQRTQFQKSQPFSLSPYSTTRFDYSFYFPAPGLFTHFPANISKNQSVVATAPARSLKVVQSRRVSTLATFADVLASGREEAVLDFLQTKNLEKKEQGFAFEHIYYLMKKKPFWERALAILQQRLIFDEGTWAFSFLHGHLPAARELLATTPTLKRKLGSFFESELLSISRHELGKRFLDFYPLINARVHKVGADDKCNILNREFRSAYVDFIFSLLEKPGLADIDRLQLATYLILQDRHHEAHALFSRINPADFIACQEASLPSQSGSIFSSTLRLQFDYLQAYFDFLFGRASNFKVARAVAERYANYPIVSWRLLFFDVSQQLREFDGLPD